MFSQGMRSNALGRNARYKVEAPTRCEIMRIDHHRRAPLVALILVLAGCHHATPSAPGGFSLASWFSSTPSPAKPTPVPKPDAKQKVDMEMELGRSLEREGKLNEALKVYEEVAKKDSRRVDTQQRLAILNDQLGNFKESDKIYAAALKREPKNAELLCDRGYSFYLQDRNAESESTLRGALAIDPHLARAHSNLGLVLARDGKSDEALMEFSRRLPPVRRPRQSGLLPHGTKGFCQCSKAIPIGHGRRPTIQHRLPRSSAVAIRRLPAAAFGKSNRTDVRTASRTASGNHAASSALGQHAQRSRDAVLRPAADPARTSRNCAPRPDRKSALSIMLSPSNP